MTDDRMALAELATSNATPIYTSLTDVTRASGKPC